jgi:hypothetical protein
MLVRSTAGGTLLPRQIFLCSSLLETGRGSILSHLKSDVRRKFCFANIRVVGRLEVRAFTWRHILPWCFF